MILTVTPNPSLDLLFRAERLVWDDANRVPMPRRRPAGQGINVVRAARALEPDAPARAVALLGGPVGREVEALLAAEGTPLRAVAREGETRVFIGVRESATGRSLLLNPRGAAATEAEGEALLAAVEAELGEAEGEGRVAWVACGGSLPPGLPEDLYARIGAAARERGHRFVPDCDGSALRLAAAAGCDLLVPNAHEAGRLLDRRVEGPPDAIEAARALVDRGMPMAVITLGAEGAVAATREGAWVAAPELPPELRREAQEGSAVGAGDALLAALLLGLARGEDALAAGRVPDLLGHAVAAGTATLLSRDGALVRPEDVARVRPHVRVKAG